jgi:hypothetical protein
MAAAAVADTVAVPRPAVVDMAAVLRLAVADMVAVLRLVVVDMAVDSTVAAAHLGWKLLERQHREWKLRGHQCREWRHHGQRHREWKLHEHRHRGWRLRGRFRLDESKVSAERPRDLSHREFPRVAIFLGRWNLGECPQDHSLKREAQIAWPAKNHQDLAKHRSARWQWVLPACLPRTWLG